MTGSGTLSPPWSRQALFNGTGYAFTRAAPFPTGAATVCLWLKWSPPAGQKIDPGAATLLNYDEDPDRGDASHRFWLTSVKGLAVWWSGASLRTSIDLSDGAWHHLAVVLTPSGNAYAVQIYVDGALTQTGSISHDAGVTFRTGKQLVVGMRFPAGSGDAFAGLLSGLAIWNSALSAERILEVMTAQLQGTETGLAILWPFDGPAAGVATGGVTYVASGPQKLPKTAGKGLYLEYEQLSQQDWQEVIKNDALVPTSLSQVQDMAKALFSQTGASPYVLPPQTQVAQVKPEYQLSLPSFAFPTGAFTICLWLKWNTPDNLGEDSSWSTDPKGATILNYDEAENDSSHRFWIMGPGALRVWFGGSSVTPGLNVADGRWHHVAVIVTPGSNAYAVTVIRDGISVYSGSIAHDAGVTLRPNRPLALGQRYAGQSSDSFCGSLSDLAIWNRALSLSEVRALLRASPSPAPDLVLYWPLSSPNSSIVERGVSYVSRFTRREIVGGDTLGFLETSQLYEAFLVGVGNPAFDVTEIQGLDNFIYDQIPDYAKVYLLTRKGIFDLITDSDPNSIYYLTADEIEACGQVLLASQATLERLLQRGPYTLPAEMRISVIFDYKPGSANPLGQIYVQGELSGEKVYRENVLTHELFHSFQYAFGLHVLWREPLAPPRAWGWMFEGTARWCEVFFYQRIVFTSDLTGLFEHPELGLFNANYAALPFWIAFEALGRSNPARTDSIFVTLFQKFETQGDPAGALRAVAGAELQTIGWNVGRLSGLDYLFSLFAVRRVLGSWNATDDGTVLYPTITDLDGNPIHVATAMTELPWNEAMPSVSSTVPIAALASAYLQITFAPSMMGKRFNLTLEPNTAASFALVRRLGANVVAAYVQVGNTVVTKGGTPPPARSLGLELHEDIDTHTSDNWVLVVNGMEAGAVAYTLKLWNGAGAFPPPPAEDVQDLRVRIVTGDAAFAGTSLLVTFWIGGKAWALSNSLTRGTSREFSLDPLGMKVTDITSVSVSVSGGNTLDLLNPWLSSSVSWLFDGLTLIVNGKTLYDRQKINVWLGAGRDSWGDSVKNP